MFNIANTSPESLIQLNNVINKLYSMIYNLDGKCLKLNTVLCDCIYGGTLTLGGLDNINGLMKILNANGVVVGYWDKDGINFGDAVNGCISGLTANGMTLFKGISSAVFRVTLTQTLLNSTMPVVIGNDTSISGDAKAESFATSTGLKARFYENAIDSIVSSNFWINYGDGSNLMVGNGSGDANGDVYCGTVTCSGDKPALVDTKNYGETYMWSEESTHVTFTDNGTGELDDNGECYVYLDDKYLETVTTSNSDYLVQLTGFKGANVEIEDMQPTYFKVCGTANKKFMWEVKAERKGYERLRFNEAKLEV